MSHPPGESTVHEVQTLRQELATTRKKLDDYADTIVSLHGELRTLRDGICSTCKRKFVPANLLSSQALEPAVDSSFMNRISPSQDPAEDSNSTLWSRLMKAVSDVIPVGPDSPATEVHKPTTPNSQASPSTLAQAFPILSTQVSAFNTIHGNEKPVLISPALSRIASSTPQSDTGDPRWSVKRDAAVGAELDVTFVNAFNHEDPVQSVRFSADGKYLAAAVKYQNENGTILIYDVETGKKICAIAEYSSQYSFKERPGINCLCFSPAGRYLVFGDTAARVTVWDIQSKRIRNVFKGHKTSVEAVDFSPNGRHVVSASPDDIIRIWNMRDGSSKVCSGEKLSTCVRFSSSGHYIAVPSSGYYNFDSTLRIWNVTTGHLVERLVAHKSKGVRRWPSFTLDGKGLVIAGMLQGPVKYWDDSLLEVRSGGVPLARWSEECREYAGHSKPVSSVVISPNGQWVVSTSQDKTAILWDRGTAVRQYTLIGHGDGVTSADFSPVGTYFATGGKDGYVTLWRY